MKKILAAITMACLALCYYNVDAAKNKNKNKGNKITQVVDKQSNKSTSNKARKNRKNKKSNQKKVQNYDSEIELDEDDDAEVSSEEDLSEKIQEIFGQPKSEKDEKEAISKVSKILNVPEEFLVIPQTTYGEKGKKKICLINPQNSQIPNRSLLVVFREYEQKLDGILSTYVIPADLKDNAKTKAKKQAYYKKSGELYDLKKRQEIETYYEMPSEEKILGKIENISRRYQRKKIK